MPVPLPFQTVTALVAEYCAEYRNPALCQFTVCDVRPWKGWWQSEESFQPGCYIIYAHNGEPIYLGKASLKATMGSRLAAHERSKDSRWADAAFVQMIIVGEPFEAPSLEEFLLNKMSTRENLVGHRNPELPGI